MNENTQINFETFKRICAKYDSHIAFCKKNKQEKKNNLENFTAFVTDYLTTNNLTWNGSDFSALYNLYEAVKNKRVVDFSDFEEVSNSFNAFLSIAQPAGFFAEIDSNAFSAFIDETTASNMTDKARQAYYSLYQFAHNDQPMAEDEINNLMEAITNKRNHIKLRKRHPVLEWIAKKGSTFTLATAVSFMLAVTLAAVLPVGAFFASTVLPNVIALGSLGATLGFGLTYGGIKLKNVLTRRKYRRRYNASEEDLINIEEGNISTDNLRINKLIALVQETNKEISDLKKPAKGFFARVKNFFKLHKLNIANRNRIHTISDELTIINDRINSIATSSLTQGEKDARIAALEPIRSKIATLRAEDLIPELALLLTSKKSIKIENLDIYAKDILRATRASKKHTRENNETHTGRENVQTTSTKILRSMFGRNATLLAANEVQGLQVELGNDFYSTRRATTPFASVVTPVEPVATPVVTPVVTFVPPVEPEVPVVPAAAPVTLATPARFNETLSEVILAEERKMIEALESEENINALKTKGFTEEQINLFKIEISYTVNNNRSAYKLFGKDETFKNIYGHLSTLVNPEVAPVTPVVPIAPAEPFVPAEPIAPSATLLGTALNRQILAEERKMFERLSDTEIVEKLKEKGFTQFDINIFKHNLSFSGNLGASTYSNHTEDEPFLKIYKALGDILKAEVVTPVVPVEPVTPVTPTEPVKKTPRKRIIPTQIRLNDQTIATLEIEAELLSIIKKQENEQILIDAGFDAELIQMVKDALERCQATTYKNGNPKKQSTFKTSTLYFRKDLKTKELYEKLIEIKNAATASAEEFATNPITPVNSAVEVVPTAPVAPVVEVVPTTPDEPELDLFKVEGKMLKLLETHKDQIIEALGKQNIKSQDIDDFTLALTLTQMVNAGSVTEHGIYTDYIDIYKPIYDCLFDYVTSNNAPLVVKIEEKRTPNVRETLYHWYRLLNNETIVEKLIASGFTRDVIKDFRNIVVGLSINNCCKIENSHFYVMNKDKFEPLYKFLKISAKNENIATI